MEIKRPLSAAIWVSIRQEWVDERRLMSVRVSPLQRRRPDPNEPPGMSGADALLGRHGG